MPLEVARERYDERGRRADHHQVHTGRTISLDALAEFQQPFHLGPVIEVDTTKPVDVDQIAELVQGVLAT